MVQQKQSYSTVFCFIVEKIIEKLYYLKSQQSGVKIKKKANPTVLSNCVCYKIITLIDSNKYMYMTIIY